MLDSFQNNTEINSATDRAFIFDMDGVIIDSENAWIPFQDEFSTKLFGPKIYKKIGPSVGATIDTVYANAKKYGFTMDIQQFYNIYDDQAKKVYRNAKPTKDLIQLINWLKINNFKIGLVSSARRIWIDLVINKLKITDQFDYILSINDRKDLESKPSPSGYIEAINKLNIKSNRTIILEDSNVGIQSAKKSGAIVIGFKEYLNKNDIQQDAHYYASDISEVISITSKLFI